MTRRRISILLEVTVPLALLAVWWTVSLDSQSFYWPSLQTILTTFWEVWSTAERWTTDMLPSLVRFSLGLGAAALVGTVGGLLLGAWRPLRLLFEPVVDFVRSIPNPALIPFAIVLFGLTDVSKVFVIFLGSLWPILLNVIQGVRGIDPLALDMARVFHVSASDRVRRILLPALLPRFFAGLRTSVSIALILTVVSEFLGGNNGVGYFVLSAQRQFLLPEMWAGVLMLGILGYVVNAGFSLVEHRVLFWHRGVTSTERE